MNNRRMALFLNRTLLSSLMLLIAALVCFGCSEDDLIEIGSSLTENVGDGDRSAEDSTDNNASGTNSRDTTHEASTQDARDGGENNDIADAYAQTEQELIEGVELTAPTADGSSNPQGPVFDQKFCSVFCEAAMQCDDSELVQGIMDRHVREREHLSSFDLCWSICLAREFKPIGYSAACLADGGDVVGCMMTSDVIAESDYCEELDDSWIFRPL